MTGRRGSHIGYGQRVQAAIEGVRLGLIESPAMPDPRDKPIPLGNRAKLVRVGNEAFELWPAGRMDIAQHSEFQRRIDAALALS